MRSALVASISSLSMSDLITRLQTLEPSSDFCSTIALLVHFIKSDPNAFQSCLNQEIDNVFQWDYLVGVELQKVICSNPFFTKRLGYGAYYACFLGRDGLVYKISTQNVRCDRSVKFLAYCKRYPNPIFPAVYELACYEKETCCSTERLKLSAIRGSKDADLISNLQMCLIHNNYTLFKSYLSLRSSMPSEVIRRAYRALIRLKERHGAEFDLKYDNVMCRKGQWVINDPII